MHQGFTPWSHDHCLFFAPCLFPSFFFFFAALHRKVTWLGPSNLVDLPCCVEICAMGMAQ
jgi:hypothetical protein